MPLSETDNQRHYDHHKAREKICGQWLKTQSKSVRRPFLLAGLAGIINGLGVIAQAALLAYILDAVIIAHLDWQQLALPLAGLLGIFIIRSLSVYWQQSLGFEASAQIKTQLRQQLTQHFADLGPAALKQQQSGALATLSLEQVEALEPYFARYLPQQMIVGVLPIIMITVVMPVNWLVGLIFLLTGPLVPIFMALIGMGAASAQRSQFLAMSRMGGYFLDRLQGLPTLKLFGQAWAEADNIQRIADNFREKTMAVLRIAFLSSAVLEFFSAVAVALVAVYAGLSLLGKIHFGPEPAIDFSQALFVLLLAPEFFLPLRQLAVFYHDRAAALAAADGILTLLETSPEQSINTNDAITPSTDSIIALQNISKTYGQRQVLNNISSTIHAKEKIALIGESGAGKTTLCNLLLGFETATTGHILLAGQALTPTLAAQHIAWSGQNAYIFYGTIKDNIALGNPLASEGQITDAAEKAGVTEFSNSLPNGLDTAIGERGFGLSGGQIQRIALARVFLKNTDIVLLDEPTANLDNTNKILLLDTIERLFKDKTVIIASHDAEVIKRMSRHIVLQQGQLLP